jgi:predicted dehydrogenase
MNMNEQRKIGMGHVGPGFIAPHHIDAVRRLGNVEVAAIAGSSNESAKRKARQLDVTKYYGSYLKLPEDPLVEVVPNTTPSHLHFPVSMAAIKAGKHVVSELTSQPVTKPSVEKQEALYGPHETRAR